MIQKFRYKNHSEPQKGQSKIIFPYHIVVNRAKLWNKERILKIGSENHQVTYIGKPIRIISGDFVETQKARREWNDIFQYPDQTTPNITIYPAKLSFKIDKERNS